jgi:hypothetical protein
MSKRCSSDSSRRKWKIVATVTSVGRACFYSGFRDWEEATMSGTGGEVRIGLNENQIVCLLKCAVKDDDMLLDTIVEKLYGTMKEFDARRAKQTVELIVDRDTGAASRFRALLDDLLERRVPALAT